MAEEKKDFPKYSPIGIEKPQTFSSEEEKEEYYNAFLKKWLDYFTEIDNDLLDNSSLIIINSIRNTLIELLKNHSTILLDSTINQLEGKILILHHIYNNKQLDNFINVLANIYILLSSISNFYTEQKIKEEYGQMKKLSSILDNAINITKEQINTLDNAVSFANLNALSNEFHEQYLQYNSERKFWGILILTILLTILCRTANITFNPIDSTVVSSYCIAIILLALWINPTLIKKFVDEDMSIMNYFLPQKSKIYLRKHHTLFYRLLTQINLILFMIELGLLMFYFFKADNLSWENLKFFNLEIYRIQYNNIYDLIPSLSIYIPLLWALWFSVKQYHYTIKLMSAYKFKMALSYAYKAYKHECNEMENSDHKEHLLHEVLTVIADDPTKRDFTDTHMPWSEVKEIFNIVSKNK